VQFKTGKCVIFSAPSGAGKTTIVHRLLDEIEILCFSVSACSREARQNERDGIDYYFLSIDEFKNKIKNHEFVEWEEVYQDNYYGTLKSEIERIWMKNKVVIFDVDVIGGLNLKKYFGDKALSVFVQPPSMQELEKRLRSRKTESEDKIQMRINKSTIEMKRSNEFDYVLLNNDLELAVSEIKTRVLQFVKE
jgi:guanylate kinase